MLFPLQDKTVRTTVRTLAKEQAVRTAVATQVDPGDRLTFVLADLTADAGWDAAVTGCDYVLHVASPLGNDNPKNPDELIIPARDGALRVLRAATKAGVNRVVMTSSCAAATPSQPGDEQIIDESLWTDPDAKGLTAYRQSKTLAEMAAWEFMATYDGPTTLTTILPGAVFGPLLSADTLGSVQVIGRLLQGRAPGTPRIGLEIVDVRDVAEMHILALTVTQAAGQRFIAVSEFMWMTEVAQTLNARLGSAAGKVPTRTLPDFLLRLLSRFDPSLHSITAMLGRKFRHTSAKAQHLLGWQPRSAVETVIACAESLIALNQI